MVLKHGKLKEACDICGNLFDLGRAKRHKKMFHEKAYECVCDICAKTVPSKDALKLHVLRAHNIEERKYKCEQCDLKFVSNHNLKEHIDKTHDTGNVYPCDQCPKTFQVRSYLQTHIRIVHQKYRPNKCDLCNEAYLYKRDLIKHRANVHHI